MILNLKIKEQICQNYCEYRHISKPSIIAISQVKIGSCFYEDDAATISILRFNTDDSRLWIPLLIGRIVVYGLKAMLPINIGRAAHFNHCQYFQFN